MNIYTHNQFLKDRYSKTVETQELEIDQAKAVLDDEQQQLADVANMALQFSIEPTPETLADPNLLYLFAKKIEKIDPK